MNYHQAWVDRIDFASKTLACQPTLRYASRQPHQQDDARGYSAVKREELQDERLPVFTMEYDILVVAVGAYSATFGIPGVKENAHFLKNVKDARAIRARILECFEIAAMPRLSDEERKRVLSFVVVGGTSYKTFLPFLFTHSSSYRRSDWRGVGCRAARPRELQVSAHARPSGLR